MDASRGVSRCSWHDARRRCRRAGCAPPSSAPTRGGCARVWSAYALGEGQASSAGGLAARGGRCGREVWSSGGGCSPTPSPSRGGGGSQRAGSSTAARATCRASSRSGRAGLPRAPIDHAGSRPVSCACGEADCLRNLNDVHTANNDRRLTNSAARVVIPLLSQRHAFLFAGRELDWFG
jgi:hypothetical protein